MNWKLVIGWSILLMLLANGVGIFSGMIMAYMEISPANINQVVGYSRIFRRVAIGAIAALCYWRLGVGAACHRAAHILAAFVLVQFMDVGVSLLLGAQFKELFEPWALIRSGIYALVGYAFARVSSAVR